MLVSPAIRRIAVALLVLAVSAGCASRPERLWLNAPDWSRAQLVGSTRSGGGAPLAVDDAGRIYLFLIADAGNVSHPRVIAFATNLVVAWDRTYSDVPLTGSSEPQIVWDGVAIQLFWLDDADLYHITVDRDGEGRGALGTVVDDQPVDHYVVAAGPRDGEAPAPLALWYSSSRRDPGLYALPTGNLAGSPALVDAEGVRPRLRFDADGTLHAVWAHYPAGAGDKPLFYAAYPAGSYEPGPATMAAAPRTSATTVMEGPWLGLDAGDAYIFWTLTYYTGERAGQAEAYYITFPHGQPEERSPEHQLRVPYDYDLPYQVDAEARLKADQRVPIGPDYQGGGEFILQIAPNPNLSSELAVAFRVRVAHLMRKEEAQISTLFFQDGVPTGYQLLSFTAPNSTEPFLVSDNAGWLYVTWLERGDAPGLIVYLASTRPDVVAALGSVTPEDVGRIAADTLFGLVAGALLVPLVLAWLVAPLVVLVLTGRLRDDDRPLTSIGGFFSLGLALLVYWIGKLVTLPAIVEYAPFTAWVPIIPAWLASILRVAVPLLIAALALVVAWYWTYRRQEGSAYHFLVFYALVDGVLTAAVYGVAVYAAF